MQPNRLTILAATAIALATSTAGVRGGDAPAHDHAHGAAGGHAHDHADHGHAATTIEVPDRTEAIWAQVNFLGAGLAGHLATPNLPALSSDAVNLAALLGALAKPVGELPEPARTRAAGMHANALRAADALAHAAAEADAAAAGKASKQLTGVLALLKAAFPKELTSGSQAPRWVGGPHGGRLAALLDASGQPAAWAEVKLHDDKGDIELWLASDPRMTQPHDLPLETSPTLAFPQPNKTITLQVRDTTTNPDEEAHPNIRNGRTNYFIFPGKSGQDPAWLKGATFSQDAQLAVGLLKSATFKLTPHSHASDHPH